MGRKDNLTYPHFFHFLGWAVLVLQVLALLQQQEQDSLDYPAWLEEREERAKERAKVGKAFCQVSLGGKLARMEKESMESMEKEREEAFWMLNKIGRICQHC